ncbi:hypothetical protein NHF46_20155 [Arthrobacter alpinus]|nr:hypothetical protein [Arthrobacter alpinus]
MMELMNQSASPDATFPAPRRLPVWCARPAELQRRPKPLAGGSPCGNLHGAPLLVGWLTGDMSVGLMASLGAFTSLYGSGRPYLNRARLLALLALSFACSVALGMSVESLPLMVVPTVTVIAMVSTYVCSVLRVGGPGPT